MHNGVPVPALTATTARAGSRSSTSGLPGACLAGNSTQSSCAIAGSAPFNVVGANYKDGNENALRFLGEMGNPYAAIGLDPNGKMAIDWGVYGIPESDPRRPLRHDPL